MGEGMKGTAVPPANVADGLAVPGHARGPLEIP